MRGKKDFQFKADIETFDENGLKDCSRCHCTLPLNEFYTFERKATCVKRKTSWCKSCSKKWNTENYRKSISPDGTTSATIRRTKSIRSFLSYLRNKAVIRKSDKDIISLDALELLWITQNGKCALTGWDLTMELGRGVVQTNCSIDRIDSNYSYVVGNVQLVCRVANIAKSNMAQSDFLAMCRSVVEAHNA